jgi:peptidoglycan DL-endopeptidase CwlO
MGAAPAGWGAQTMRKLILACTLLVAVAASVVAPLPASASPQSELASAGDRLDRATELYNQARIRRAKLDSELVTARSDLARSESKLAAQRRQLGTAVRYLYMHPAAGLGTFFQARSFGELERGSALAGRSVLSTDTFILKIRKARAEERASASRLQQLRDQARRDELAISRERVAAASAFQRAQSLLRGALAAQMNAQRRARLAAAGALAAANITFNGPVRPGAAAAVRAAASQIGKPYRWGAAGPDSYDCSGLTMWSWAHGGVSLPHSSGAQYSSLPHVSLSNLAPGDLVFYGSPIHHVGIYAGGGRMIHAPQTGETVRYESIYAMRPIGAARP